MSLAQPLSGFWTKAMGSIPLLFFFQHPLEPLSLEKTLLALLVQRQRRWSEWRLGTITALSGLIPHSASERVLSESLLNSRPPLTWQTSLTKGRESPTCSPQTFLMECGIWVLLGTWAECCWPPGYSYPIPIYWLQNLIQSCIQNCPAMHLWKEKKASPNRTSFCLHCCSRSHSCTAA